jgi:putative phosphonate transport system ATP-binding protein
MNSGLATQPTVDLAPPVLEVLEATRIHGPGCPACRELTGPEAGTNVCSRCGSVVAVAGACLTVHASEVLGVIGESGSGKSSLIRLCHGDDRPSSGSVRWHGNGADGQLTAIDLATCDAFTRRWLQANRLGIVHQHAHRGLHLDITAGGNVAERLLSAGRLSFAAIRQRAAGLMTATEIPLSRMDQAPATFSGGMQQRVQIARALAPGPSLLLLDEVTTGLDLSVQARILDLILELQHRTRVAMLVVTHDLGVARLLAQRTVVMRNGRIVEHGLTDQVLEDPQHPYTQQLVSAAL